LRCHPEPRRLCVGVRDMLFPRRNEEQKHIPRRFAPRDDADSEKGVIRDGQCRLETCYVRTVQPEPERCHPGPRRLYAGVGGMLCPLCPKAAERRHNLAHGVSRGKSGSPEFIEPRRGDTCLPGNAHCVAPAGLLQTCRGYCGPIAVGASTHPEGGVDLSSRTPAALCRGEGYAVYARRRRAKAGPSSLRFSG